MALPRARSFADACRSAASSLLKACTERSVNVSTLTPPWGQMTAAVARLQTTPRSSHGDNFKFKTDKFKVIPMVLITPAPPSLSENFMHLRFDGEAPPVPKLPCSGRRPTSRPRQRRARVNVFTPAGAHEQDRGDNLCHFGCRGGACTEECRRGPTSVFSIPVVSHAAVLTPEAGEMIT